MCFSANKAKTNPTMWFLIDSHTYFEERSEVPFFEGLVAVFLNGGITFLTATVTLMWMARTSSETLLTSLESTGFGLFVYAFLSSFVTWGIMGVTFYMFILWEGETRVEFFSILSMAGLGFVPLMIGSIIEFIITTHYSLTTPATSITTTHALIAGEFGILPMIVMMLIHALVILWSCHIWNGGVHQLGNVSPKKSIVAVLTIGAILFVELIILALQ